MRNYGIDFYPDADPDEGAGGATDGSGDSSTEDVISEIEENDQILRNAGQIPQGQDSRHLSGDEIRALLRDRANQLDRDDLEASKDTQAEIRKFNEDQAEIKTYLATLGIKGSELASDQEIELLWENLLKNPSLVKDFILYLIDRKTKNHYSEYPLLPHMKDILAFADDLHRPEVLRPRIIKEGVYNLENLTFDAGRCMEIAMGSNGEVQAEGMRILGWLAGMPFMRGAQNEIVKHNREMGVETVTVETLAHAFIVIMAEHIDMLKERTKLEYQQKFRMDYEAYEFAHQDVLDAMEGLQNLLFSTFIKS